MAHIHRGRRFATQGGAGIFAALILAVTPTLHAEPHAPTIEAKAATENTAKPTGGQRITAQDVAQFKALAENQDHAAYYQKFEKATAIIVDEIKARKTNAYWVENTAAYLTSIGPYTRAILIKNIARRYKQKDIMGVAPLLGYVFEGSAALRKCINKVTDPGNSLIVENIMASININKEPTSEQVVGIQHLFASFDDAALPYALSWISHEKRMDLEVMLKVPVRKAHPKAKELAQKVHAYRKKHCKVFGTKVPGRACDGL